MSRIEQELPPVARQLSVQAVVDAVLQHGPITRTQLASITGLSKQTMSEVVRGLERDGWLSEGGQARGAVGRSAVIYEFQESSAYGLGIDLGGSKVRAGIATLNGKLVAEDSEETDRRGGVHVVAQIIELFGRIARHAGIAPGRVRHGVVAVSGVFQPSTGAVRAASNIPGIDVIDFGGMLRAGLGMSLGIENTVDMATKGEHLRGRAQGCENFVVIAHGAGIGMGAMIEGRLLRGRQGAIGEIAFLPIGSNPFDPRGFAAGTLESEVGAAAIVQKFEGYGGFTGASARDIFNALAKGHRPAIAVVDETARLLALAIASVASILDPEMVVMGGRIGVRPELLDRVREILPRCTPLQLSLEPSALGERAQLEGALGTAVEQLYERLFGISTPASVRRTAEGAMSLPPSRPVE